MNELTWQQQEELGGGSSVDDTIYGEFAAELGGIFVPSKSAETEAAHYKQLVNLWESINRRLANTFQGYVCKDAADTDLQYSVKAFSIDIGGLVGDYAEETAKGPLTAAVANYVYADLSAFPTITVTSATAGWPTTPHVKLAVITPPASGAWKLQHIVRWTNRQAISVSGGAPTGKLLVEFAYNTASPLKIGWIAAGRRVTSCKVVVETPFNAGTPSLTVGDSGNNARLQAAAKNKPLVADSYQTEPNYKYAGETDLNLYITPSTATAGAGFVLLEIA